MTALHWHRLDDAGLVSDWEDLAAAASAGPFMRPGWFRAWDRAFAPGAVRVAVKGSGAPDGIMPLIPQGGGYRAPVNEHSPEFRPITLEKGAEAELVAALVDENPSYLEFLKLDAACAASIRAEGAHSSYRAVDEVVQRSPYLEVRLEWNDFEHSLSSSFRQGLRRKKRRLEDKGISIDVHDGLNNLESLLVEGFAVESSQWKAEQGTAIYSDPRITSFYREVAQWAAASGLLRLVFLRQDGRALAFRFDLVCDNVYYHVKGGYDPAQGRFSPGLVLQHETVRRAWEEQLIRYEFLGADEPYKMKWTDTVHERHALRCFAPTVRGRLGWMRRRWAAPALKRARSLARKG